MGAAAARKPVTILFCDLVGSTALGERLDAERFRDVLGRWHAAMRAPVEQHGGTVEKFIGDALEGVFGVPSVHGSSCRGSRSGSGSRAARWPSAPPPRHSSRAMP